MEGAGFITQDKNAKEISFKELVLEHQRRILKISCKEFTKTDYTRNYGNYVENIKGTDNALNFIQAIEVFALLLYPHFDKEMETKYKELTKCFNCWTREFKVIGEDIIEKYIKKNESANK